MNKSSSTQPSAIVVKEGTRGLKLDALIELPGVPLVTAEVQLSHRDIIIPLPAGEVDRQGTVRLREKRQVFRQLRCHIKDRLGELLVQIEFVRRPVGGTDVVEKLRAAPVAQHFPGNNFLIQHHGAAVGHVPVVKPDFLLSPERPDTGLCPPE